MLYHGRLGRTLEHVELREDAGEREASTKKQREVYNRAPYSMAIMSHGLRRLGYEEI